jgi:uncharacterized membrane protein YkgB
MRVRHLEAPTADLSEYYHSYGCDGLEESAVFDRGASLEHFRYELAPPPDPQEEDLAEADHPEPYVLAYAKWLLAEIDWSVTVLLARHAVRMLQLGIGVVFVWFGALKLVPGLSPAEELVLMTLEELFALAGFSIPLRLAVVLLAVWEVAIGLGFLLDRYRRAVVWNLMLHLFSTALPLVVLPEVVWRTFPHGLTLEGQYIVKNLVILAGAATVGATVRGGYLTPTGPQDEPASEAPDGEWGEPADAYTAGTPGGAPADAAGGHLRAGPSRTVPKVWVVDEDGALLATYELENYARGERASPTWAGSAAGAQVERNVSLSRICRPADDLAVDAGAGGWG